MFHGRIIDGLTIDLFQLGEIELSLLVLLFLLFGIGGDIMLLLLFEQKVFDLCLECTDLQVIRRKDVDGLEIFQCAFEFVFLRIC